MASLALVGGMIYIDPSHPVRGTVLIEHEKISAVGNAKAPPRFQSIDCSGKTILAGFWNSHVHFFQRKWADAEKIPAPELQRQLEDMLTRFGFTSAFDLSSIWENTKRIRNRIESGEITGPRIRSTGEALLPANPGLPPDAAMYAWGSMKVPIFEIADAGQAAAHAKHQLDAGTDAIKLFVSAPSKSTLSEEMIKAAVAEAHGAGKPVFVHPNTAADVLAAVRGGVDVIGHTTPASGPWDPSLIAAMKQAGVAVIPTFTVFKYNLRHDRVSLQDQWLATAVEQLRAWVAAGGDVLFGTDAGFADYDPSTEYELMAKSGMKFAQILASLTTAPAERFGESKRLGRIATGMQADLVVVDGDPAHDIRALTNLRLTLRDGKIVYRR